jgi:hypothetical protein
MTEPVMIGCHDTKKPAMAV